MKTLRRVMTALLALALCACAAPAVVPTPAPTPPPPTTTPTATPVPPPSLDELDAWDLIVISDSSGWGLPDALAERIERDRGVIVRSQAVSGPAAVVRAALEGGETSSLRLAQLAQDLSEAEMVVILASPVLPDRELQAGPCMGPPPYDLSAPDTTGDVIYAENLTAILAHIRAQRGDAPILVRAYTYWHRPGWWREGGVESECRQRVEALNDVVRRAAQSAGVPVAEAPSALNGPDLTSDPFDLGYLGEDREHLNDTGTALLADLIISLGYEPTW